MTFFSCASSSEKSAKSLKPKLLRETAGLSHCESVVYDEKRNVLYVSVQGEKVPGDGSIAKVSIEGKILDLNFISGLNNPKGIALDGDKLYVSDVTELVEVDLKKAKVSKKYAGLKSKFLNDVAVDAEGNVYVSDMHNSSIYKLSKAKKQKSFKLWFESAEFENPNGLLVVDGDMYVAAWGRYTDDNPGGSPKGGVFKFDLGTKVIERVTAGPLGHLDGIQVFDKKTFLITDWLDGKVFLVAKNGFTKEILDTEQSVGDHVYLPNKNLMILPMNKQNKLMFYSVK